MASRNTHHATKSIPSPPSAPTASRSTARSSTSATTPIRLASRALFSRYGNVYGPGQDPHGEAGVVAIFSQRMLSGEQAVIFGNGLQERDFVFVGDVAAANVAALSLGDGETLNIGTGEGHSVNELYSAIAEATDCDLPPVHEEARPGEVFRITLDASRAQKVLGWRAPKPASATGSSEP